MKITRKFKLILLSSLALLGGVAISTPFLVSCSGKEFVKEQPTKLCYFIKNGNIYIEFPPYTTSIGSTCGGCWYTSWYGSDNPTQEQLRNFCLNNEYDLYYGKSFYFVNQEFYVSGVNDDIFISK